MQDEVNEPDNKVAASLPTISFMIRHGDAYLHHEFVAALLNDLFGIQSRGGCACAGPYSVPVLGIEPDMVDAFKVAVAKRMGGDANAGITDPGFTRLNVPYFASDAMVDFIKDSLLFLSDHAWKFLPFYRYDASHSTWVFAESHSKLQDGAVDETSQQIRRKRTSLHSSLHCFTLLPREGSGVSRLTKSHDLTSMTMDNKLLYVEYATC